MSKKNPFKIVQSNHSEDEFMPMSGPERSLFNEQMKSHRKYRCARCIGRYDFEDGRYICMRGMDAGVVMSQYTFCTKFYLCDDPSDWLEISV